MRFHFHTGLSYLSSYRRLSIVWLKVSFGVLILFYHGPSKLENCFDWILGKNVFITGKKKDPTKQIGFKQGCPYQIRKHFVKPFVNIPLYR